jgi:hypothetical protein
MQSNKSFGSEIAILIPLAIQLTHPFFIITVVPTVVAPATTHAWFFHHQESLSGVNVYALYHDC